MNIPIKLTKTQLNKLVEILQDQQVCKPERISDKCMFYLYSSALKKLLKKQIDKADDFTYKLFKVSLKYEEATAIYMEIIKIKDSYGVYEDNLIRALSRELHQKLY